MFRAVSNYKEIKCGACDFVRELDVLSIPLILSYFRTRCSEKSPTATEGRFGDGSVKLIKYAEGILRISYSRTTEQKTHFISAHHSPSKQ